MTLQKIPNDVIGAARIVQNILKTKYMILEQYQTRSEQIAVRDTTTCEDGAGDPTWSRSVPSCGPLKLVNKTPSSIEELMGSIRLEPLRFLPPFEENWKDSTDNETHDENIREMICFRFYIGHISFSLACKDTAVLICEEAYDREQMTSKEYGKWLSNDLTDVTACNRDASVLHVLLTVKKKYCRVTGLERTRRAVHINFVSSDARGTCTDWNLRQMSRDQWRVLTPWWTRLNYWAMSSMQR